MSIFVSLLVEILGLVLVWHFFYNVTKAKSSLSRKIKVTIVVLLFSSLIIRFTDNLYAWVSRAAFSLNKTGEVNLVLSPFKIPAQANETFCQQFKDQSDREITTISSRNDGNYCGEFWNFKSENNLMLPYKDKGDHMVYWASPSLTIVVPKKAS